MFTTGSFAICPRPSPVYICHTASITRGHDAFCLQLEGDVAFILRLKLGGMMPCHNRGRPWMWYFASLTRGHGALCS